MEALEGTFVLYIKLYG